MDGVQCFKAAKPLQRDNILFEPTFGQYSGFEPGTPGLGMHHLDYKAIMEVYWKIQFLGEGGSWKKKYIGGLSRKEGMGNLKEVWQKKEGMVFLRGRGVGGRLITQCILCCFICNSYFKINYMQFKIEIIW